VGLVQREIEAAGISTIILSTVPELSASVSVPRLAAIEFPFGLQFGCPGDRITQMAILRASLQAVETIAEPGTAVELPFSWTQPEPRVRLHPPQPPPISKYLIRHPWLFPRLLKRDVPPVS
jgi:D-proline reductase (dithiol) PrdB